MTQQNQTERESGVVGMLDQQELRQLPAPDFFVNGYAGCSTGQQWDAMTYRVFNRELPVFNVSLPMLWGNKPDAGYMRGEEWEDVSTYAEGQLRELIGFLEQQTGRPFDWDTLSESMSYIKRASSCGWRQCSWGIMALTPATYWDCGKHRPDPDHPQPEQPLNLALMVA